MMDGGMYPTPWTHFVASQYVNWCHIDKFWSMHKHDTHVKKNATHFSRCKDHCMKLGLVGVHLAIWGTQEFKYNVVPLYMTQMVYTKVALGVEMDWSNIPTSSRSQWKPNLHHRIAWLIETWPNPLRGKSIL